MTLPPMARRFTSWGTAIRTTRTRSGLGIPVDLAMGGKAIWMRPCIFTIETH
jgi:hypothetical protein